jgi:GNAT superfamily N-acetyltransferase
VKERGQIKIRTARRSDTSRFADLMSVFKDVRLTPKEADNRLRMIANDAGQSLAVATVDRFVVGLLAFRIRQNLESVSQYGEISAIVVDPDWQNEGIGHALLEHAEDLARKRKCIGLWLVSGFAREEEAHKFYEGAGFSRTGIRFVKALGMPQAAVVT